MNVVELHLALDFQFERALTVVEGIATLDHPPSFSVTANDIHCFFKVTRWQTLDRVLNHYVFEFAIVVHISEAEAEIDLNIVDGDQTVYRKVWTAHPEFARHTKEVAAGRAANRAWLLDRFRCPVCRVSAPPNLQEGHPLCSSCGVKFFQRTNALQIIDPSHASRYGHEIPKQVSWHEHGPGILTKIDEVKKRGGKVLDFGAGFKTNFNESVISLELIDYPLTDLIASGDNIPVRDASFDLVLCISVLEHVQDPFACGAEIERVLAPGGELYCVVPFLFPLHAHPHHYYNMTFAGVRNLFSENMQTAGTRYGHPIKAVRQIVHEYFNGLPAGGPEREAFRQVRVDDLLHFSDLALESQSFVKSLSSTTVANLAHGTHTWFRKG